MVEDWESKMGNIWGKWLARTVLVEQHDVAAIQVDSVSGAQAGDWSELYQH